MRNLFKGATISSIKRVEFSLKVSKRHERGAPHRDNVSKYTFACYQIAVQDTGIGVRRRRSRITDGHIIRFLIWKHDVHESGTIEILLWTPSIPWVFPIVQIGHYGNLEGTIVSKS